MTGQSRDWKKVVPECSGQEISRIFLGKIRFPGNGIRERRPLLNGSSRLHENLALLLLDLAIGKIY